MTKRAEWITGGSVVLLAIAARIPGLDWGLPHLYEEATPFREAWEMWGWGDGTFDPNPRFFHYPSLFLYVQLLGQAVVLGALKASGSIGSSADVRALYAIDPTPLLLAGRVITALFGTATVGVTFLVGRRLGGTIAGASAAGFLAINPFHVARSQRIEVDVPLTFFLVAGILFALRLREAPTLRGYVAAGLALGLAASTKYTGAVLLVPLLAAHLLSPSRSWAKLAMGGAAAGGAFLLTSPFVALDAATFWSHLTYERRHMALGHFGTGADPGWLFYGRQLVRDLGVFALILAAAGLVLGSRQRRSEILIVGSFVLAYGLAVGSWSMQAVHYALPLSPAVLALAAIPIAALAIGSRRASVAALIIAGLAATPAIAAWPAHLERLRPDTRTQAKRWIESTFPPGSFVVTEPYGPELFDPATYWKLDRDVRARVRVRKPVYAVQPLPLFQLRPERTAAFYDLDLYADSDLVVTTSDVRARYEEDPDRFAAQLAFYEMLGQRLGPAREFSDGPGPVVRIYRNPEQRAPFAHRDSVHGPRPIDDGEPSGWEAHFYSNLGLNYEMFGFREAAGASYEMGLGYPRPNEPGLHRSLALGVARALTARGDTGAAHAVLEREEAAASTEFDRAEIRRMRVSLERE